ncbi:MAG: TonB-dependent receptor [Sphingomonas sp.]|nr:TonB-dependent receptor [Sphingomonas sp.]
MAQDAPAPADDGMAAQDNGIVVTGFRAALESAVSTKKRADQIVESVSAEDIGKLPDASIAESIARLPGLSSQRVAGRDSVISVRGFGPDFATTTLNGRLQTSTNDARAVEFDQFPAEVVNGVDIYKSPKASLVGQGLAGSVDIRTIRPLSVSKNVFAVGAKGIYVDNGKLNPGSHDFGYRLNATYIGKFMDDRLGIAISAAYLNEPYQEKDERSWGYPGSGTAADPYVIGGLESNNISTDLKRLGLTGTLQYEFTPNLTLTIDGFYSNFKDSQTKRGVEIPLAWGGAALSNATVQNGVVTAGTFANVPSVVNNKAYDKNADLYSVGGNLAWKGDSGWGAMVDIGWSRTDRVETEIQTNAGTGPGAAGANDTIAFTQGPDGIFVTSHQIDYSNTGQIFITDPNGWGGGAPGGRQHGYLNNRTVDDEILQFSGEVSREFEGAPVSALHFGGSYVSRDKSLTPDEYYLRIAGTALQAAVPQQYLLSPITSWVGLGKVLSYDMRGMLAGGFFDRVANTSEGVRAKAFQLSEDVASVYAMADLQGTFGGGTISGNIGVRAEHTDQTSDGFIVTAANGIQPYSDGAKFWDVLPSANVSFRWDSGFVVRLAAAREIMRPRMDDMAAKFSYGYDTNLGIISGSSGNPRLRPYRALAFDLSLEKYWGNKGYVAAQFFYKALDSFVYQAQAPYDWSGFPNPGVPGGGPVTNLQGVITFPINGKGGTIYGVEVAGTLPFETFVSALDGFGITGGVSYTIPEVAPSPGADPEDIPGYSRWVANGTAYFEKWGLNVRGSIRYRSTYRGDFTTFDGNPDRRRVRGETLFDAQIGYDFQPGSALEGLSVFVQGQNLTNEPFVSYDKNNPVTVLNYQTFGRRFYLGATYKF